MFNYASAQSRRKLCSRICFVTSTTSPHLPTMSLSLRARSRSPRGDMRNPLDEAEAPAGLDDIGRSRSRSPFGDMRSPLAEGEAAVGLDDNGINAALHEMQPEPKFKETSFEVEADVGEIGFSVSPVLPGWRDITINPIVPDGWAHSRGLKLGD